MFVFWSHIFRFKQGLDVGPFKVLESMESSPAQMKSVFVRSAEHEVTWQKLVDLFDVHWTIGNTQRTEAEGTVYTFFKDWLLELEGMGCFDGIFFMSDKKNIIVL